MDQPVAHEHGVVDELDRRSERCHASADLRRSPLRLRSSIATNAARSSSMRSQRSSALVSRLRASATVRRHSSTRACAAAVSARALAASCRAASSSARRCSSAASCALMRSRRTANSPSSRSTRSLIASARSTRLSSCSLRGVPPTLDGAEAPCARARWRLAVALDRWRIVRRSVSSTVNGLEHTDLTPAFAYGHHHANHDAISHNWTRLAGEYALSVRS